MCMDMNATNAHLKCGIVAIVGKRECICFRFQLEIRFQLEMQITDY